MKTGGSDRDSRPTGDARAGGPRLLELLALYAPALVPDNHEEWLQRQPGQVGLTVVTRTTGSRPEALRETLLCLSGQTSQDFESIVTLHNGDPAALAQVRPLVSEFDGIVGRGIQVLTVAGGERGQPIHVGFEQARGWYATVLDDDDLVMAHWVETLLRLAGEQPGHVVRVGCATRRSRSIASPDGRTARVDETGLIPSYVRSWDHWTHIAVNQTPVHAYAVPVRLTRELGIEWNGMLPVVEDWDFLIRAAGALGVVEDLTVAAVYNRDHDAEDTSYATVAATTWRGVETGLRSRFESTPAPIPPMEFTGPHRIPGIPSGASAVARYRPVVEHYWRTEGAAGVARGLGRVSRRLLRQVTERGRRAR